MVVSIREVVNIQFSYSLANTLQLSMTYLPFNMDMNNIKERFSLFFKTNSRDPSISLNTSSTSYYECMEINNNLPNVDFWEPIDSSQLSYKNNMENKEIVSKIADTNIIAEI